jgi:hypothetical protein
MPPCPTHRMFRAALSLIAFCGLTTQACGAAQTIPDSPELTTTRMAQSRVHRSLTRAAHTQAVHTPFQTWIRFNPAPCECPRWELQIYGDWERMEPMMARDADPGVAEVLAEDGIAPGAMLWADVLLTDDTVVDRQGWVYPVYDVRRVSEDPDSFQASLHVRIATGLPFAVTRRATAARECSDALRHTLQRLGGPG